MLSRSTWAWISVGSIGFAAILPSAMVLSRPTSSAPATAVPTRGGEVLRGAAQRADVAGELLRRGGDQDVEQQRHQRALADAEQDQPEQHRDLAPVVAHDEGEPDQRDGAEREAVAADLPRRQPVVETDDQHRREEDGQVERHHRDRGRERRAALHDLDVERHREVQRGLQRHHREQGVDRARSSGESITSSASSGVLPAACAPVRPQQEGLARARCRARS